MAIILYFGIPAILEKRIEIEWAALRIIMTGILWAGGMSVARHFLRHRKDWNFWGIGKPNP
jgi:hypothetical protein